MRRRESKVSKHKYSHIYAFILCVNRIDKVQSLFEIRYFILWFSFRFNCWKICICNVMRLNTVLVCFRCSWSLLPFLLLSRIVTTIYGNNSPLKVCLFFNTTDIFCTIHEDPSMQRHWIHTSTVWQSLTLRRLKNHMKHQSGEFECMSEFFVWVGVWACLLH